MLAFVDPARVPLWMAAGPALDVYTTERATEDWFRRVFCAAAAVGGEEGEGGELDEVRQCGVGVLVGVLGGGGEETDTDGGGGGGAARGDWAVTELLLYGRVERRAVGVTPPRSSPEPGDRVERGAEGGEEGSEEVGEDQGDDNNTQPPTATITHITIHALPLTSHHNFSAPLASLLRPTSLSPLPEAPDSLAPPPQPQQKQATAPLTPTNTSRLNHALLQKASFLLPNPLDSPQISKSVKKRRADVLSQAVENRKRGRLLPVAAPLPPSTGRDGMQMHHPHRRQSLGMASLHGHHSREPSVARSLMREGTAFSVRDRDRDRDREWGGGGEGDNNNKRGRTPPSPDKPASLRSRPGTSSTALSHSQSRPGTSGMPIKKEPPAFPSSSSAWPAKPAPSASASRPASRASGGSGGVAIKREHRASTAGLPAATATTTTTTTTAASTPTSPAEVQVLEETVEARNKDSLSRMVMSGMKLYGLKRGGGGGGVGSAEAEEYKFVYHHTFKSAVFALRGVIGAEVLEGRVLGEVVERLLGVFCVPPGGGGRGGKVPLVEALVEIDGLKGRVRELEREVARKVKKEDREVKKEDRGEEEGEGGGRGLDGDVDEDVVVVVQVAEKAKVKTKGKGKGKEEYVNAHRKGRDRAGGGIKVPVAAGV